VACLPGAEPAGGDPDRGGPGAAVGSRGDVGRRCRRWQPVTAVGFDGASAGEDRFAIYVWRWERFGGDTKTEKSRRTLALPQRCVAALREHWELQARDRLRAGEVWKDHGLVFASTVGTPLSANNVIRAFRAITKKAGLGEGWVPREMRHTFVSVLSANGVPVESIALLAGHERTATTESVYRHEIRPALVQGAEVMDKIFG
jgi:integrase